MTAGWLARLAAAVLVLDVAAMLVVVALAARIPEQPSALEPAAAVVFWPTGGQWDDKAEALAGQAVAAWREGRVTRFLCVGGRRTATGFHGSRVLAERLAGAGVPAERIAVGPGSHDTRTNLAEAVALAGEVGERRLLLMSDALHLLRIRAMLADRADFPQWAPLVARPSGGRAALAVRAQQEVVATAAALLVPDAAYAWLVARLRRS